MNKSIIRTTLRGKKPNESFILIIVEDPLESQYFFIKTFRTPKTTTEILTMTTEHRNKTHTLRIMNDIREFYEENIDGIFIVPSEDNICLIHALIIGPPETPYENGFFYFVLKYPDTYPLNPPNVQLRTTSRKNVRFSPNLYSNGKVCLSILGTWEGPSWCSAQTIFSTLVSIRSLMDSKPYHNEPGHEKNALRTEPNSQVEKCVSHYNDMIVHETLRVAVAEMLQETNPDTNGMPDALREIMLSQFKSNYEFYEKLIESNRSKDGHPVIDPFRDVLRPKTFDYKRILESIVKLKDNFSEVDENSTPTYKTITKNALMASSRDVLKSEDYCEDFLDYIEEEEDGEEGDLSTLYESESESEDNK